MASQENGPVEFTLDREEIEVNLKQKDVATPRECVLREMDGHERDAYLNSQRSKIAQDTRNLKDFNDVQTSLIAQSLYDKSSNEKVSVADIRKFPSKLQSSLYKLCVQINGLDDKAEAEAKNA